MFRRKSLIFALLALVVVALAACAPQATPQVIEVTKEVVKEVQVEVTKEVVKEVQVVVTPTPAPVVFKAPRPDTFTYVTFGDVDTLDPALAYDTASGHVLINVYEGLIFYNGADAVNYVPALAEEVPSLENGGISPDGMTYTFKIRKGVKFHNGNDLTPSDFEYSFERGLLQSDPHGPQWLLLEPLLGYDSGDVTQEIADGAYAGDPEALKANATPEQLQAVCEKVKAAVEADDAAGTLTLHLAQPWGPMLATLAQSWGAAVDKEWAIEQGDWDGSCDTWVNFYSPGAENSKLSKVANGTGPYKLESWEPGIGWTLVANENYWRTDDMPVWPGGPAGKPRIKRVVQKLVEEWGTRFAMLQAGEAEVVAVPIENRPQVDQYVGEICDYKTGQCQPTDNPNAPLRAWPGLPSVSRTDVFLNFNVAVDENGRNPYIGSGQLDGNGIPPNFFSDIHVRRAMAYCFDYDAYIEEALNGEGVRNNGPIITDMLGYNPNGPMYEYNLDKCAEELAQAWDGKLPEVGFRFQIAFNTGNTTRQTVAAIFQNNLRSINEKYQVEIIGLPWPTLLRSFRARQLPVAVSGWLEDIHDPHNWVQPYGVGTFAGRQNLPADLKAKFQELINQGVQATDPAEREKAYFAFQQLYYEEVPTIILAQATGKRYEQRWVKGFYYNPIQSSIGDYYYAFDLER